MGNRFQWLDLSYAGARRVNWLCAGSRGTLNDRLNDAVEARRISKHQ